MYAILTTLLVAVVLALAPLATATAQTPTAAGSPEARAADETFQALIAKCDQTDVLVLRAQIRNKMSLASEEAAKSANDLMTQGLAKCGEGKVDEAKADLTRALELASAGVTQRLETQAESNVEQTSADDEQTKPWWQFW